MKATVIGAGNCSYAMAADLSNKGIEVTILVDPDRLREIAPVAETGMIELYENDLVTDVTISCVTVDPEKGLAESQYVFLPIPAYGQKPVLEWIADYLCDGQTIVFAPGYLGSIVARNILKERGITKGLHIGETNETIYNAKKLGGNKVRITDRGTSLYMAAFPKSDSDKLIKACKDIYNFKKAEDVFHCTLNATNPIYHVSGCVLNAGRIERSKGEFYLYEEGLTPAVTHVMELLDKERIQVMKTLGYSYYTVVEELANGREPRTMWEEINGCCDLEFIKGPESLQSRYLTEDIPYGISSWIAIGELAGLTLPIMNSLKVLGGAILGKEWNNRMRDTKELDLCNLQG